MNGWPARWGWPGAAAVLALSMALPLAAWWTPQWQAEAREARSARATAPAGATVRVPPAPPQAAPMPPLPAAGDPAERVAALLHLAQRHGVTIDAVQQRPDRGAAVPALQLDLTVSGRYADVRALLAAALAADPALALDRLLLRRQAAGAALLQAELRWSLLQPRGPAT